MFLFFPSYSWHWIFSHVCWPWENNIRVFVSVSPAFFRVDTLFTDSGFTGTVTQQFHPHLVFSLIRAGNIRAGCQIDPLPERSFCLCFSDASWEFKVSFHGILKQNRSRLLWSHPVSVDLIIKAFTPSLTEISFIQNYLTCVEIDKTVVYLQAQSVFSLCF